MYENILVPTDGTPEMTRAIDRASELAAFNDATIHFVYALDLASFMTLSLSTSWETLESIRRERGREALHRAENRCGIDRTETAILDGEPSREIVAYADRTPCDLIVMGTHGRNGLHRLLLGSVTEHVVRAATVPVMTLRLGDREPPEPEPLDEVSDVADPAAAGALE